MDKLLHTPHTFDTPLSLRSPPRAYVYALPHPALPAALALSFEQQKTTSKHAQAHQAPPHRDRRGCRERRRSFPASAEKDIVCRVRVERRVRVRQMRRRWGGEGVHTSRRARQEWATPDHHHHAHAEKRMGHGVRVERRVQVTPL